MLIGSGLQALATSGKFKPVALGQIRTAGNTLTPRPLFRGLGPRLQMKLMAPVGRSLVFSGCIVQDILVL